MVQFYKQKEITDFTPSRPDLEGLQQTGQQSQKALGALEGLGDQFMKAYQQETKTYREQNNKLGEEIVKNAYELYPDDPQQFNATVQNGLKGMKDNLQTDEDKLDFLTVLEQVIGDRLTDAPENSYTASLAALGPKRMAQKIGEEGVELALAAVAGDREEVIDESADLLYHVLVMLRSQDIALSDVVDVLEARHVS